MANDLSTSEHDCFTDGCQYEGSLFCIWCGLTAEDRDEPIDDTPDYWEDNYIGDSYYPGTGELIDDESYINYLNGH